MLVELSVALLRTWIALLQWARHIGIRRIGGHQKSSRLRIQTNIEALLAINGLLDGIWMVLSKTQNESAYKIGKRTLMSITINVCPNFPENVRV